MKKFLTLFSICLVFFLINSSIIFAAPAKKDTKKEDNAPALTNVKPIPTELKEGSFTVKLGDKIDNSLKWFGRPRLILNNGESYTWRSWINLYSPELVIKLKPSKVIWTIIADHLPMIRTPENIGFGNTKEEIEAVYGKSKGYVAPGGDIIMSYGGDPTTSLFMRFRLSGDKEKRVIYMVIGNYSVDQKNPKGNAKSKVVR